MAHNINDLKLTSKQLNLLHIVFKFRFVTSTLLSQYRNTDKDSFNKRLQLLVNMKLLVKDYDPKWRIDRRPAEYSLSTLAIKLLREEGLHEKTLHSMYNNRLIKQSTRQRILVIMQLTVILKQSYRDQFYYYTANDLAGQREFPLPRPSLYLLRVEPQTGLPNDYFIELCHTMQPFAFRARFKELLQHYDDEGWQDGKYPSLLFILETERQEKTFGSFVQESLDSAGIDDLMVYTTTHEKLISSITSRSIWSSITDSNKSLSLLGE